jgi:Lsr2
MVQKTEVILTDDTDGTMASETVSFALDRANYEIDLNDINALALRETLARYIANARRIPGTQLKSKKNERAERERADLRKWAADNGYTLSPRGRIPGEIRAKWDLARQAAHASGNGKAPERAAEPPAASPAPSPAISPGRAAEPGSGPRGGKRAGNGRQPPRNTPGAVPERPAEPPAASPAPSHANSSGRAAEPGSGPRGDRPAPAANGALSASDRAVIRAWAKLQGISIGDRGRISAEIIDQFRAAHAKRK